jgi:hypothetical protein
VPSATNTVPPKTGGDPVIGAAGDIACDPTSSSFNAGNGTTGSCRQKAVSDVMLNSNLTAVLTLGDTQYEDGTLTKYQQSYDPSWGRLKGITRPAVGNHEYETAGASGYFDYFGAAAGEKTKGYYSYDIGAWHIIALNSMCSQVGGCGVGSSQEKWLKADLAAHPNMCTLAYWHHPRFSSGQHGSSSSYDAFWKALYASGVEIVLNGHDHHYERFNPQNPSAAADPNGIQEFIVGTGGKNHYSTGTALANSVVRNSDTYGFLKLTLRPTSYDWQFIPEPGKTFTDSGTRNCFTPAGSQPTVVATNTSTPANPAATITPTKPPAATIVPTQTGIATNPPAATIVPTQTTVVTNPPTATPPSSVSGAITFIPAADAYVTAAIPNTNFGASKMLRFDSNPVVKGYLMFNVQGLTAPVTSARLRIYANSSSTRGCNVYAVPDSSWVERSITFNNAPAPGNQIGSIGAFKGGKWIEVDVTAFVTGNGTYSIALTGINSTAVSLASRETGSRAPQLIIVAR